MNGLARTQQLGLRSFCVSWTSSIRNENETVFFACCSRSAKLNSSQPFLHFLFSERVIFRSVTLLASECDFSAFSFLNADRQCTGKHQVLVDPRIHSESGFEFSGQRKRGIIADSLVYLSHEVNGLQIQTNRSRQLVNVYFPKNISFGFL